MGTAVDIEINPSTNVSGRRFPGLDDRPLRPAVTHIWRQAMRNYPAFWVILTLIVLFTSEHFSDTSGAVVTYYGVEKVGQHFQGAVRRPVVDPTPTESRVAAIARRWRAATFRWQLAVMASVGLILRIGYVITKRHQTLDGGKIFPGDQFYYSLAADALAKGFVVPWHDISVNLESTITFGLAGTGTPTPAAADRSRLHSGVVPAGQQPV